MQLQNFSPSKLYTCMVLAMATSVGEKSNKFGESLVICLHPHKKLHNQILTAVITLWVNLLVAT